jgi:hypothetical protein
MIEPTVMLALWQKMQLEKNPIGGKISSNLSATRSTFTRLQGYLQSTLATMGMALLLKRQRKQVRNRGSWGGSCMSPEGMEWDNHAGE